MEPGDVTPDSEHAQFDQANQVPPQSEDWTELIHDLRFVHSGKYVCGYVDSNQDLVQLLESYRVITGTAFTSSQNLVQAMKGIDQTQLQMRFMSPASRPRLFWQMNAGEPTIQYDGVPFMSVSHGMDLPCVRFGGRRKKVEQVSLPSGEVMPVDYRMKTGCEAKITIRRILRYPCAKYNDTVVQGIAAVRRHRKKILEDLVQRIIRGSAKFQERYHFLLPTPMAHNGHVVAEIDGPPPVAQQVMDEILTQLNSKVVTIPMLHDRIKIFTSDGQALHSNDPIFFPTEYDIFRQVYWLYKLEQVGDPDGNFKSTMSSLNVMGIEKALTQAVNRNESIVSAAIDSSSASPIVTTPSSSDAITNVYSIIMDDGSGADGTSPLHQISADQEVELNSGENSTHLSMMEESPIASQIQIGMNASPVSVPQVQIGGGGSGTLIRDAKRRNSSVVLMSPANVPVARPFTTSISSHGYKNSHSVDVSPPSLAEDDSVSQAQTEVQSMLRIIENQTHACKNLSALNNLRRQLTELCGQFSVYLAGGSSTDFGTPSAKRART